MCVIPGCTPLPAGGADSYTRGACAPLSSFQEEWDLVFLASDKTFEASADRVFERYGELLRKLAS